MGWGQFAGGWRLNTGENKNPRVPVESLSEKQARPVSEGSHGKCT